MNKAEEKAIEYQIKTYGPRALGGLLSEEEYKMFNMNRDFLNGYLQAEESFALTMEDMKTLDDIFFRVSNEMSIGDADNKTAIENYYKEVLRRFNKYKCI